MPTLPNIGSYQNVSGVNTAAPACAAVTTFPLQVDLVDNQSVTDHYYSVPLTTNWQTVTIFFNQAINQGVPVNPTALMAVKFEPMSNGTTVTALNYSFTLDNIKLVNGTAPAAASAQPKLITNFDTGSNLITWTNGGTQSPGAIYVAGGFDNSSAYSAPVNDPNAAPSQDPNATVWTTCTPSGVLGASFFPQTPGYDSQFAAHVTGAYGDDTYPWIQLGLNLQNPRAQTNLAGFGGVQYYAKLGSTANAVNSFQVKFPNIFSDPQGGICNNSTNSAGCGSTNGDSTTNVNCNCADDHAVQFTWTTGWVLYTVNFSGSTNYPTQSTWGGPVGIDFVTGSGGQTPIGTVYAVQFQTAGSSQSNQGPPVDFWVDDVTFF